MRIYVPTYVATGEPSPVGSVNAVMNGGGGLAIAAITGGPVHQRLLSRATRHLGAITDRRQPIATVTGGTSPVLVSATSVGRPRRTVNRPSNEQGGGTRRYERRPGKSIEAGAPTPTPLTDPSEIGSSLLRGSLHNHSGVRTDRRQTA